MPFDADNFGTLFLLKSARDTIERGWTKGVLHDSPSETYCAIGSLRKETLSNDQADAVAVLYSCLPWRFKIGLKPWHNLSWSENRIAVFNDSAFTRKKDVLALYDRAIAKLERELA